MVQVHLGPPFHGDVAQLGEHLLCTQGVAGSIPVISTIYNLALDVESDGDSLSPSIGL